MASSISSSEIQAPALLYGRIWGWALAMTVAAVLLLESLARLSGFSGMPADDRGLWCLVRHRLREQDPSQVAFIGSSRMQLGLDPDTFASQFGTKDALQLAITGSSPIPVLNHLAHQTGMCGLVVCDLFPLVAFRSDDEENRMIAEQHVQAYLARPANMLIERRMKLFFEMNFACLNSRFRPFKQVSTRIEKGEFEPPSMQFGPDRFRRVDYSRVDPRKKEFRMDITRTPIPIPPDRLGDRFQEIEQDVSLIQARGGRVVFVRFPVSGEFLEMEENLFPRTQYWDAFARQTQGLTIHFQDYEKLAGFVAPDGSHLDYRDAEKFSLALAAVLTEKLHPAGVARID